MLTLPRLARRDEGASLLIAVVFVGAVGIWVIAIIQLAFPNLATTGVVRANRSLNYDADAAMAQDIAVIRFSKVPTGQPGAGGTYGAGSSGYCPAFQYPTSGTATVTVSCAPKDLMGSDGLPVPYERWVQLTACAGSATSCATPLSTVDVYYFDDKTWGRAAYVSDWSTR